MYRANVKPLADRLNAHCTEALEKAAALSVSMGHYEVTIEHFLTGLLESRQSDLALILRHFGLDRGVLERSLAKGMESFRRGNAARPVLSPLIIDLLHDSWTIASVELGEPQIRSGAVLLAVLASRTLHGSGAWVEYLRKIGFETLLSMYSKIIAASSEVRAGPEPHRGPASGADGGALAKYCIDFSRRAREGRVDPVFGREAEIRQLVNILARRRKNNPIIVGDAGVGKTAVVEGLALKIKEGDVPEILSGVTVLCLDLGLLEAGASVRGEFEKRLKAVIEEARGMGDRLILFIDEAHMLVGAGGPAGGSDAANLLKPVLARGEVRFIAATTWPEYKKYFEKDPALSRRFMLVRLDEPDVDATVRILRGLKARYEEAHGVHVPEAGVEAAARLSDRYLSGRRLPDKAVDVLDTACARVKVGLAAKPGELAGLEYAARDLGRRVEGMERDRMYGDAVDGEELEAAREEKARLENEAAALSQRFEAERDLARRVVELRRRMAEEGAADLRSEMEGAEAELRRVQQGEPLVRHEVDADVVARVVADWTGIPLGKLLRDESSALLSIGDRLKTRIRGQDEAVETIARELRAAKSGILEPGRPMGVFLLTGPSGVGKTETGLAVADILFGGESSVVSVNMSEYQERHTVSRLIGSPPGYVGYGEGGILTEAVRQRPYCVVLLDEAEKASPDVMNLFYQVFDKGVLADGEGRNVDFSNTVMFLTSNLGDEILNNWSMGARTTGGGKAQEAVRPILTRHFRPALLARMTVVPYLPLRPEVITEIAEMKLACLAGRIRNSHRMEFIWSGGAVSRIAAACLLTETGARNIDYVLHQRVLPRISREIITRMAEGTLPAGVRLEADAEDGFRVEFWG